MHPLATHHSPAADLTTPAADPATAALAVSVAPDRDTDAAPGLDTLPLAERRRVMAWQQAFEQVDDRYGRLGRELAAVARMFDASPSSVRRKWDQWIAGGRCELALIDGRVCRPCLATRTKDPAFIRFFRVLCGKSNRSTATAIRELKRQWKAKWPIPGYEDFPGWPAMPEGWSERNLRRYCPTRAELAAKRRGMKHASTKFSQVLTTRTKLWPGAIIQFDDVWHDHRVRVMDAPTVSRILEFGCLDVYSAARYDWASKPRLPRNFFVDGKKHDGLSEREFRLFAAGSLFKFGYNAEHGTRLQGEGGTAKFSEPFARTIYDATRGRCVVSEVGITGEAQAILGLWTGRAGGNPRAKTHLESLHGLIHNEMGLLPGQTGKDRQHDPEESHGLVRYQEQLMRWARELPAHLAEKLRHPLLEYFSEFLPLRDALYRGVINGREDHALEGWIELGRIVTEYTLAPGSDAWVSIDDIPPASMPLIHSLVQADPAAWSRRRALTPGEVFERERKHLTPITMATLCDLLGPDMAVPRRVEGPFFAFRDADVHPTETLFYESVIITPEGHRVELRDGERYNVFSNPYHPDFLLVCDGRLRCLGVSKRASRVSAADHDALKASWGAAATRQTERLKSLRGDWDAERHAANAMREGNRLLIEGWRAAEAKDAAREDAATADDVETMTAAAADDAGPVEAESTFVGLWKRGALPEAD